MKKIGGIDAEVVKERFLKQYPRIEEYASIQFSNQRAERRAESIQNTICLTWKGYCQALENGKNPDEFISVLVGYAAAQTRDGRSITGQEPAKDAMSGRAQRKKEFRVEPIPEYSVMIGNNTTQTLADTRHALPPEQAQFRIDTPAWLERLLDKKPLAEDMMEGYTTKELARRHKKSPGRISQIRQELSDDYHEFHGESVISR